MKSPEKPPVSTAATSATTTKTTTTTTTAQQQQQQQSSCIPCIQLLQDALTRADSRPALLLQSMMETTKTSWRKTELGVQVEIPAEKSATPETTTKTTQEQEPPVQKSLLRRHWSMPPDDDDDADTTKHLLSAKQQQQQQQQQKLATSSSTPATEWMNLSCKVCATTGPEANARAFVMGPTPLSIVVCQNRLQSIPQQQQQQQQLTAGTATAAVPLSNNSTKQHLLPPVSSTFTEEQRAEMDEILTHELIHVYDVRQLQLDLRDCQNLAYSEVRAAREAECASQQLQYQQAQQTYIQNQQNSTHNNNNNNTHNIVAAAAATTTAATSSSTPSWAFSSLFEPAATRCVRNKALTATNNLFPETGKSCIRAVFDKAYADQRPFVYPTATSPASVVKPTPTRVFYNHNNHNHNNHHSAEEDNLQRQETSQR